MSEFFDSFKSPFVLPPYSNTGVQNTSCSTFDDISYSDKLFLIDYLQFSLKNITTIEEVKAFFDIDNASYVEQPRSLNSMYTKMYTIDHRIRVYLDGRVLENEGVHIEMRGQDCRYYEAVKGDLMELVYKIMTDYKFKFARTDLTIDLKTIKAQKEYFTLRQLHDKLRLNHVRMKFRRSSVTSSYGHSSMDIEAIDMGTTIYLGSKKSDLMIRFYDKLRESIINNKVVDDDLKSWLRIEVMLRDERANIAMMELLKSHKMHNDQLDENTTVDQFGINVVSGILANYVNFVEPSKDTNKARWLVSPFWTTFLNDISKLRLTKVKSDMSVLKTETWINKQIVKSIAFLKMAYGGDLNKLHVAIDNAMEDLSNEQIILAEEYRKEQEKIKEENIKLTQLHMAKAYKELDKKRHQSLE